MTMMTDTQHTVRKHQLRTAMIAGLAALTLVGASACKTGGTDSPNDPGGVNDPGLPGGDTGMGGGLGAPGGSIQLPAG
jgi:hypothetical protein